MNQVRWISEGDRRGEPLDIIEADNARHKELAEDILELAEERDIEALSAEADALLDYLTKELPRHARSEEGELGTILRARCGPEDQVERILGELHQEHSVDAFLGRHVALDLRLLARGEKLDEPWRLFDNLKKFAEDRLKHIAWEDDEVLPLARRRLLSEDLGGQSRSSTPVAGTEVE
jgi:hemerythrin-like domain-containing protein